MKNNKTIEERIEKELEKKILMASVPSKITLSGKEVIYDPEYLIGYIHSVISQTLQNQRKEVIGEIISRLEAIREWPEPGTGARAGEGLGDLAGTGMILQYKHDKEKHREQIDDIIKLCGKR